MNVLNSLRVASKSAAACAAFSSACSAATCCCISLQGHQQTYVNRVIQGRAVDLVLPRWAESDAEKARKRHTCRTLRTSQLLSVRSSSIATECALQCRVDTRPYQQTHMYLSAHCATHCSVPLVDETSARATMAARTCGSAEPAKLLMRLQKRLLRTCRFTSQLSAIRWCTRGNCLEDQTTAVLPAQCTCPSCPASPAKRLE